MDRRNFIKTTSILGGACSVMGPSVFAGAIMPEMPSLNNAMRWAQVAFAENDPKNYDPDFWLDYFKRIHADGVLLSAGGVVAFYPTTVPLHHRSAWLGDSDPLDYLIRGCRKMNMSVILRTDPHAARQEVYDAHPDWIAVTAKGEKQKHWADPELWVTCALGPYNFDFMTAVHREIMERYSPDGLFANRWSGPWSYSGMCYCEHCLKNFKRFSGLDIPRNNKLFEESTRLDPAYIKYRQWGTKTLRDIWSKWDNEIHKVRPSATFIPNGFPDKVLIGKESQVIFSDMQQRIGAIPPWANGRNGKEHRATMGMKPLVNIFSIGAGGPARWVDSVQTDAEIRIWVAEGVANGMRPCFVKFGAVVTDKRWLDNIAQMYGAYDEHEKYLKNTKPVARVGLVTYEPVFTATGQPWQQNGSDHLSGMYHALVEGRIPFEMVHPALLDEEHLASFKLLILSNLTSLSDQQCDQLRRFTARGGSLLATFETSLYDENSQPRTDFGLADLFGVSFDKTVEGPMKNSYLKLREDPLTGRFHPVLKGLEDARQIINGFYRIKVIPKMDFTNPVTLIPTYPDLPMEEVYKRVPDPDTSELYLREINTSRIAYFPWDIERSFWQLMTPDHLKLLVNTIQWALNEEPLINVDGPGVIDTAIWMQNRSMTVHLVNLTNPMMMKGPFREFIPVEAGVSFIIPDNRRVEGVRLLMSNQDPVYHIDNNRIIVENVKIKDHEIIAVDFNG